MDYTVSLFWLSLWPAILYLGYKISLKNVKEPKNGNNIFKKWIKFKVLDWDEITFAIRIGEMSVAGREGFSMWVISYILKPQKS